MSYDISLRIDTGGETMATVEDIGNYTANVSGMWHKAMVEKSMADLDGMLAHDAIPYLQRGVISMILNPSEFRAMEPPNGWGDYSGALEYLRGLLDACSRHPRATIRVWH